MTAMTLTQSCSNTRRGTCSGEQDTLYMNCTSRSKIRELMVHNPGKLVVQPDLRTEERVAGSNPNVPSVQQNA